VRIRLVARCRQPEPRSMWCRAVMSPRCLPS
jgi:hypothetical protein